MRILITVLAVVGLIGACTALRTDAQGQAKGVGLKEHIQDLQLTDEQEAKIAEIRNSSKPKVLQAAKELAAVLKEEVDRIESVLTSEQKTKLGELKEERKELRGDRLSEQIAHLHEIDLTDAEEAKIMAIRNEFHPKIQKAMMQLEGLLTDTQKKAREEDLKAGMKRREIIASLKLTDEQKTKMETVGKELRTLVHQELDKFQDVLNQGQTEKLQEFKEERKENVRDRMAHRIANLKELNLTEPQKTQISAIRKTYQPRVHEAGSKLRAPVREEVAAIVAVIKG